MDYNYLHQENRTGRENGCVIALGNIAIAVMLIAFLLCFASCSTHRNVCGVTFATGDSLSQYIEQTFDASKYDSSAVKTQETESTTTTTSTTSDEEETETIVEQITEHIDTAGTTVRNISRTITRKRTTNEASNTHKEEHQEQSVTDVHVEHMDSLYKEYINSITEHWKDCTTVKEEKDTGSAITRTLSTATKTFVGMIALILMLYVIYIMSKKWQNNQQKQQ